MAEALPERFLRWFQKKGWDLHSHQFAMLDAARHHQSALLVAPTGGGKTLAGFLPSLITLADKANILEPPKASLHTLYISPLKALAADIERNLMLPITEMDLPLRAEMRTGDTCASDRQRQRQNPPDILITTPESLQLMLAWDDADHMFGALDTVILDELHALAGSKRGDLLALLLARLRCFNPDLRVVGLSATIATPDHLRGWLHPDPNRVRIIHGQASPKADLTLLDKADTIPWAGHSANYAIPDIYQHIKDAEHTLVFVNTRAQAEILFQQLWRINDDNLTIGLHHGSLSREQRQRIEAHMAAGKLRAVIATSSLDLGIDWADVDLVIQVGAPKSTSRLMQRIGRSGHRYDQVSRAVLIPSHRFEVLECLAAMHDVAEGLLDDPPDYDGGLDILAQHLVGLAIHAPFDADDIFAEIKTAWPYRHLTRDDFDETLTFLTTGGYALKAYEKFHKLKPGKDGLYRMASRSVATQWRLNAGVIVETQTMKVDQRGVGRLGEIEEYFVNSLVPGDSFMFAGRILRFQGIRKAGIVDVVASTDTEPKVPAYAGGRLPLTSNLADRIRDMMGQSDAWGHFPLALRQWLSTQSRKSSLPDSDSLLVETFPRGGKFYMVIYGFEGRNAHQTLGMLVTRRMERLGLKPIGFVATDYAIAVWSLKRVDIPDQLLSADMMGDDLEEWMLESSMLKRAFRVVATIAGLLEKRLPGASKTGRQMTINSDLIYDVLLRHQPDHMLIRATRQEAARGLTDIRRLSDMLTRFSGRIKAKHLNRASPLALPLMLEVGREVVTSSAVEDALAELEQELLSEVMKDDSDLALSLDPALPLQPHLLI
ncbi:MAG: ligase-associated DNA damage response DEXH box helicase [Alphaproteobacteria bacterium]|nr:ligase-associated DNA damage response DEXH box helicase [Alphaproteobacteria bacterium]